MNPPADDNLHKYLFPFCGGGEDVPLSFSLKNRFLLPHPGKELGGELGPEEDVIASTHSFSLRQKKCCMFYSEIGCPKSARWALLPFDFDEEISQLDGPITSIPDNDLARLTWSARVTSVHSLT